MDGFGLIDGKEHKEQPLGGNFPGMYIFSFFSYFLFLDLLLRNDFFYDSEM